MNIKKATDAQLVSKIDKIAKDKKELSEEINGTLKAVFADEYETLKEASRRLRERKTKRGESAPCVVKPHD